MAVDLQAVRLLKLGSFVFFGLTFVLVYTLTLKQPLDDWRETTCNIESFAKHNLPASVIPRPFRSSSSIFTVFHFMEWNITYVNTETNESKLYNHWERVNRGDQSPLVNKKDGLFTCYFNAASRENEIAFEHSETVQKLMNVSYIVMSVLCVIGMLFTSFGFCYLAKIEGEKLELAKAQTTIAKRL